LYTFLGSKGALLLHWFTGASVVVLRIVKPEMKKSRAGLAPFVGLQQPALVCSQYAPGHYVHEHKS
jgi:hypothetical protein